MSDKEQTLSIIKPDACERNLSDKIKAIFSKNNLAILNSKKLHISKDEAAEFYKVHQPKPFYDQLCNYLSSGPTEVMIISDGCTNPKFIAYDLLSQAEHGIDSQVILISQDNSFLEKVAIEIDKAIETISTREIAKVSMENSKFICVNELEDAFQISNNYAPEHLIINCQDAEEMLPRISSAGSVFLGEWSPESAGDYCSGTNHVLPTAGFATSYSGLSVDSFCKSISVQSLSKKGLQSIGDDIINLAMSEGLEAHAKAVSVRIEE